MSPVEGAGRGWITTHQAAARYHKSAETIRRWVRGNNIRAKRVDGVRYLNRSDLDAVAAGRPGNASRAECGAAGHRPTIAAGDWLTLADAAAAAGVSKTTVIRWAREGRVVDQRCACGHRRYIRAIDIRHDRTIL